MLRTRFSEELKESLKAKDQRAISTLRLILAALKDRDIAARGRGNKDGIGEEEVLQMLQTMIKQRRESIEMYTKGAARTSSRRRKARSPSSSASCRSSSARRR